MNTFFPYVTKVPLFFSFVEHKSVQFLPPVSYFKSSIPNLVGDAVVPASLIFLASAIYEHALETL